MKYQKIQTLYKRDPETHNKGLLWHDFSLPEFKYLSGNEWLWTEKIDGTNIRIFYKPNDTFNAGSKVYFGGRTDNAQIPAFLLQKLQELFPVGKFVLNDLPELILYGEGYGNKIQKVGNKYIPDDTDFALFDVRIGNYWLRREDVEDIGSKLGINVVPIVGTGNFVKMAHFLATKPQSTIAEEELVMEGIVARPMVDLLTRSGDRIITKMKVRDLENTKL